MARKKTTTHDARARAKDVARGGTAVRDRVRELSVRAFRDRKLSAGSVSKLVHEVLEGAVEGVDASIPKSSSSVLRGVFDGLSEGVHEIASAGSGVVRDVRKRGGAIAGRTAPGAARRIRAANEEFLGAVKRFARGTSKEVRQELDALVATAKRTGPKVVGSAKRAAGAAEGRWLELSGETARAGVDLVRRAAGTLAMGAGGLLEGLAEAMTPKEHAARTKSAKASPARTARKKKSARKSPRKKMRKG